MRFYIKEILIVISLLLLVSCSSPEHKEALRLYEQAKANKNIHQLAIALNTLAKIAPKKYQEEFVKVDTAKGLLEQAQQYQVQGNYYQAYLTSHESYRSIPSTENKKILQSSGKVMLPILNAQLSVNKSFQYSPKMLSPLFEKHSKLPIEQWNLIEINSAIKQLSITVNELTSALTFLQNKKLKTDIPELVLWENSIAEQYKTVLNARDYFSNIARYHGAKKLTQLNKLLTTESSKLLSLVRPKFAQESMQSSFLKAQGEYATLQNVIANLSLAESLSNKDIHASWYKKWQKLESNVLEPKKQFIHYPVNSTKRETQLSRFINNNLSTPALSDTVDNSAMMVTDQRQISQLLKSLVEDKALLL